MFEILHEEARLTEREYKRFNKGNLIFGEYTPKVVVTFETKEEADEYLKSVHCTYIRSSEYPHDWLIEEYGYIEEDSCGTVTVNLADEPEKEYIVYNDFNEEVFRNDNLSDAEAFVEKAESEARQNDECCCFTIEQKYKSEF